MSNRDIQSFPMTCGNHGIVLKSSADEVPITAYTVLYNVYTDRENTLSVRRGCSVLATTDGAGSSYPDGYLIGKTNSYRYARNGTAWMRATVGGNYSTIATGLSGNPALVAINPLNTTPYIFLADGTKFIKDNGTACSNVGLAAPTDKCTVVLGAAGVIVGENISYTYTYYDSDTATESDYATPTDATPPETEGTKYNISFTDTPPAAATHRRLYRMGDTIEQFQLVAAIPIATLTHEDNKLDGELGAVLDLENQVASGVPRAVVGFDNRLFIWGISTDAPNMLRFSKRNAVESFPTDYWIPVGTGGETILRCVDFDGELFIFTNIQVYRLIGTDVNSYRAINTNIHLGLASYTGVTRSQNALYMASYDGIYEFPSGKRISEPINPIWRGQVSNGIKPLKSGTLNKIALGFFNQSLYVSYTDSGGTTMNNVTLSYDPAYERWHCYGLGVPEFFEEAADPGIAKDGMLLAGDNASTSVFRVDYGATDDGTGILWGMETKDLDLGAPGQEKQFVDLMIDMDTGNSNATVQYGLDRVASDSFTPTRTLLGTITGETGGRKTYILPFPNSGGASIYGKRITIEVEGTSSAGATIDTQMKIFKITPRFLLEPMAHKSFVTDWSDEGSQDDKIWRELHIEYDSKGVAPTIYLDIDGTEVYNFAATATSARTKKYYSFPTTNDYIGTKARLRISTSSEIKLYDFKLVSIPVANPLTTYETAWSDEGAPNILKRFRKIILEVDNIGPGTITVTPEIDGVAKPTYNISTNGRAEDVYSFPVDTTGFLWRIKLNTTTTMRVYSVRVEALQDPTYGTTYESAWALNGTQNRKRFRDILLDIDTAGQNVTVTPWIDGAAQTPFTVNTASRMVKVLALPVDTTGILTRITTVGVTKHTVYNHQFTYAEEPNYSSVQESQWSDEGIPYDKLWKHMVLDIDTKNASVNAVFWLDGAQIATFAVQTNGRKLQTISLGQNRIGKLGRVTVSNTDTQLFGVKYAVDPEPPDVTVADSYEQDFGADGWKILKRLYAAIKAPAAVTIKVYADEVLKDTVTVTSNLATGYAKVKLDLAAGIKGKLFRFVMTSAQPFKFYWSRSQVEMKIMNQDDGWQLYKFSPPQSF